MIIYAHTMTYPAFAASKQPVIDKGGRLIGGPDRRLDDERTKWLAWQRDVKAAERVQQVPADVMDYFQKTKPVLRATNVSQSTASCILATWASVSFKIGFRSARVIGLSKQGSTLSCFRNNSLPSNT